MVDTRVSQYNRYGHALNTHDSLKIIGIILMIIDHVGQFFFPENLWLRLIGRGAAPLFFFLVGYDNRLRISVALLAYGSILSFTGYLLNGHFWINILLNFVLIDRFLHLLPPERLNNANRLIIFVCIMLITCVIFPYIEYGLAGLLIAFSARLLALKDPQGQYYWLATLLFYYVTQAIVFGFFVAERYLVAFGILTLGLFYGLRAYSLRPIGCPAWLLPMALVISRYSLAIYFYHLILLQSFSLYQHPTATLQSFLHFFA